MSKKSKENEEMSTADIIVAIFRTLKRPMVLVAIAITISAMVFVAAVFEFLFRAIGIE